MVLCATAGPDLFRRTLITSNCFRGKILYTYNVGLTGARKLRLKRPRVSMVQDHILIDFYVRYFVLFKKCCRNPPLRKCQFRNLRYNMLRTLR